MVGINWDKLSPPKETNYDNHLSFDNANLTKFTGVCRTYVRHAESGRQHNNHTQWSASRL